MENVTYTVMLKIAKGIEELIQGLINLTPNEAEPETHAKLYNLWESWTDAMAQIDMEVERNRYLKQCCTCERIFFRLMQDGYCPWCGSGNWVYGYIDCPEEFITMAEYKEKEVKNGSKVKD